MVVHNLASDHGQNRLCPGQLGGWDREDILREHSQIGQFAGFQTSFVLFRKLRIGRGQGISDDPCSRVIDSSGRDGSFAASMMLR
jgi:hypothetical protein